MQKCPTWEELAREVNNNPGSQLLEIGFQMEDIGDRRIYYQRNLIQSAVFHEDLFSIRIGWSAIFSPFLSSWFWLAPPSEGRAPVQVYDISVDGRNPICENVPGAVRVACYELGGTIVFRETSPITAEYPFDKVVWRGKEFSSVVQLQMGKWIMLSGFPEVIIDPQIIKDKP